MTAVALHVHLGEERVGAITYIGGDRTVFGFDDAYIDNPDRPTLSLSFRDAHGDLILDHPRTQTRLLPFFSNLLPEGALLAYLAERAGVKPQREHLLLAALGADLPGAVRVRSAESPAAEEDRDAAAAPPRNGKPPLRFSLAGVQLKFSGIARTRGGMTIPVTGAGGDWIIKLPSTRFAGISANEFAMMTLARMTGMDIPDVRLVPLADIEGLPSGIERIEEEAFAIRRFDRSPEGRVHMEDFAQVFGVYPEEKYAKASYISLAKVLWIETGEAGITEFIRRLVFNTLIGNADMHLKNWSLLYPDGRQAVLSPGYDFVATTAYIPDENAALRFGRSKRMADLSLDELSYLAAKAGLPQGLVIDTAKATVAAFREVWARERANLPISKAVAEEIERLLGVVPVASGA